MFAYFPDFEIVADFGILISEPKTNNFRERKTDFARSEDKNSSIAIMLDATCDSNDEAINDQNSKTSVSFTIPSNEKDRHYAELIPGKMYLGDFSHAFDPNILKSGAFTHILNVSGWGGLCCQRRWNKSFGTGSSEIPVWKIVKIRDLINVDIMSHFEECFEFLDSILYDCDNRTNKVFIHCQAGISRSSTIAIAYLMKRNGWTIDRAYQHVLDARPIIKPNKGFMQQLLQYHSTLHSGKMDGSEQCQRRLLLNYLLPE